MSRPPLAREKVLDAFEQILIDEGERAATMDATARTAGVSKGGLLYHFGTKDALESALLERLVGLVDEDIAAITNADEGPVAYFLRSSAMESSALDRTLIAVSRLAQSGNATAVGVLHDVRRRWSDTIRPHVADESAHDLVMLVSDGLYYNNALAGSAIAGPVPRGAAMNTLITLVEAAVKRRP
ncbi:TetR/AcrR family transcriptional regulator [Microbacterium sp. C7(2022)]|uniref:TetR/AcrR family transcriptional regulator n=1 Tax=Microbacterium sp. C7(2022) TaxID=2992759 RepID=UPI00237A83A1|nr:TetR/AcrR family transcriptional regulator [Microbacterium sp. C7(2022)]MDE0545622.1 TetR/AcrR family transcriptional regulator [Microbacterium sp. C7(2022)]